jgi:hypothetical protein
MVKDWAMAGCECYCVDIQHSIRKPRVEAIADGSITFCWGDVRTWKPKPILRGRIVAVFAFPPCTDVSVSGARDFSTKGLARLVDALTLFNACEVAGAWSGAPYMIENPVGVLTTHIRKWDHRFDPWNFGDLWFKSTCLWTGNGFIMPPAQFQEPPEGTLPLIHTASPGPERANFRSQTPPGFARAVFEANFKT